MQSCTAFDDVPGPGRVVVDSSVDASVDATPLVPNSGNGLLPFDEAAAACSRIVGCKVLALALTTNFRIPLNGASYSYCIAQLTSPFEPNRPGKELVRTTMRNIIAAKGPCQERLDQVEHEEVLEGAVQCAVPEATMTNGRCLDSQTAVYCNAEGGAGIVDHCGKPAGTSTERCVTYDGGAECARVGACGMQCNDGVYFDDADRGGGLHHCLDTDCNALGLNCIKLPTGEAGCSSGDQVKGARRRAGGSCRGDSYVARAFFFEGELDCAKLGAHCIAASDGRDLALCTPTDAECSPFDADVDVCGEGSRINLCVGGRRGAFDCASVGLACLPPLPDSVGSACR